ncbi:hypothetical protein C8R46DRAFT_1185024 [Mycena filopes]|nr:hypothetical protein C8R46DRAFT_1185024 [Mycena filopes]
MAGKAPHYYSELSWHSALAAAKNIVGSLEGSAVDDAKIVLPNAIRTGLLVPVVATLSSLWTTLNATDAKSEANVAVAHVDSCVQDPPNPRNSHLYIPPARPNLTQNPELQQKAQTVLNSLNFAYSSAIDNTQNPDNVARNKVRGPAAIAKAVPHIQVKLSKAFNASGKPATRNSNITPTLQDWAETESFAKVKAGIAATLDYHYLTKYGVRVTTDDFILKYTASQTALNSMHTQGTLADLWRASTGVTISLKDRKTRVLDLQAVVEYPRPEAENEGYTSDGSVGDSTYSEVSQSGKRKAAQLSSRPLKRLAPGGANLYRSSIQLNEEHFVASRIDCVVDERGVVLWKEDTRAFSVSLRKDSSAAGSTKKMYILTLDNRQYAAKCFFDIGGRPPTREENFDELKKELLSSQHASRCLTRFQERATANKIPVADLRVADAFILRVAVGPQTHHAWIVDPLLNSLETVKFSGTDVAGNNIGLFGATCDAFAHFSLEDSDEFLVFVDIQGVKQPQYMHGVRGADELVMFDFMAHTRNGGSNVGDKGPAGLDRFKLQHKCNSICRKIPLKPLDTQHPPVVHSPVVHESTVPPLDPKASFRVRLGSGVIDSDAKTTSAFVRYAGAAFNHTLTIDDPHPTHTSGPFGICEVNPIAITVNKPILIQFQAKLAKQRGRNSSSSIFLYSFIGKPTTALPGEPDVNTHEISRYTEAQELMAQFEDALAEKSISLGPEDAGEEDVRYVLSTYDFKILQAADKESTWLYCDEILPDDLTDSAEDLEDATEQQSHFSAVMEAFSHFVLSKPKGAYLHDHFQYTWNTGEDGDHPLIVYFQTSTLTGKLGHNDGGHLGIADFKIRHDCGALCKALELSKLGMYEIHKII